MQYLSINKERTDRDRELVEGELHDLDPREDIVAHSKVFVNSLSIDYPTILGFSVVVFSFCSRFAPMAHETRSELMGRWVNCTGIRVTFRVGVGVHNRMAWL